MDWLWFKQQVSDLTVAKDALHVYGAFVVQVLAALVTRRTLASPIPWLAVFAAIVLNEALDLIFEKEPYIHRWQIEGSIHDLINTMALPTLLLLLARFAPGLFERRPKAEAPEGAPVD